MKLFTKCSTVFLSLLALGSVGTSANARSFHHHVHHHRTSRISRRHYTRHFTRSGEAEAEKMYTKVNATESHPTLTDSKLPKRLFETSKSPAKSRQQANGQDNPVIIRKVHRAHPHYRKHWFKDGLSRRQLKARNWIVMHESGRHWIIESYGHECWGYFQLNKAYLGYHPDGKLNLGKRHQVRVADNYVRARYGNWVNAKKFWESNHWY